MLVLLITIKLKDGHHRVLTNVKSCHLADTGNFLVVDRLTGRDNLVVTKIDSCQPEDLETILINRDEISEVSIVAQVDKPSKVISIQHGKSTTYNRDDA